MRWGVASLAVTSVGRRVIIPRTRHHPLCEVAYASDLEVACLRPLTGWPMPGGGVVFSPGFSYVGAKSMEIACGQCIGCRLDKSREWATRMTHEASCHDHNCFLTLTYSDEHLPEDGSLSVRATQLFLKRLRKALGPTRPVRYFTVGEYGDLEGRPHYHSIIFGYGFQDDRQLWRKSPTGHPLYRSPLLEQLWPFGHSEIGSLTPESTAYVARYALKKLTGEAAKDPRANERPHPVTGQLFYTIPPFARMSLRPGLGAEWIDKFRSDAFPSGFVTIDGQKRPVPRYYVTRSQLTEREELGRLVKAKQAARAHAGDRTPERLEARERLQQYRQAKLVRDTNKGTP